jgi:hypothetical protein
MVLTKILVNILRSQGASVIMRIVIRPENCVQIEAFKKSKSLLFTMSAEDEVYTSVRARQHLREFFHIFQDGLKVT